MSEQLEANISGAAWRVGQAAEVCFQEIAAYHATWASAMKPTLTKDGDMWCALHGGDLATGICGFGPTPALALMAFETAMCSESGSHVIERKVKPSNTLAPTPTDPELKTQIAHQTQKLSPM